IWLAQPDLLANVVLHKNVDATLLSLPLNPLAPLIATTPTLYVTLQYSVLVFEGLFFLALLDRDLRKLLLGMALVFHAINANWLIVTFTPILVVYGLFIDWQSLRQRFWPWPIPFVARCPGAVLVGATVVASVGTGLLWNAGVREWIQIGGWFDWRTIWWPFGVLGLVWIAQGLQRLGSRAIRLARGGKAGVVPPSTHEAEQAHAADLLVTR
ncbi:MAG: hypothetical protein SFU86_02525, partial [Pirellulaceae bacterium]|nr:hypothetical protein [Pirellulaceae bacterium]